MIMFIREIISTPTGLTGIIILQLLFAAAIVYIILHEEEFVEFEDKCIRFILCKIRKLVIRILRYR